MRADYKATVVVDGLKSSEVKRFTKGLRQLNIRVRKVRGIRDESDALIRLATEQRAVLRRRAETQARTVPVRLLFPLVFLVLPAFGLLTVVPALLAGFSRS